MEAKRQKMMDVIEVEDCIIYDPEGATETEPVTRNINDQTEVEHLCEPDTDVGAEYGTLTDNGKLMALLTTWGTMNFYEPLRSHDINYDDLKYLENEDYARLAETGNLKIKEVIAFRNAHREWMKSANVHYMMAPSPQYPLQYYYQCQRRTGSQAKKQQKNHCHHYQPHYQPYAYHHLAQYHPGLFIRSTDENNLYTTLEPTMCSNPNVYFQRGGNVHPGMMY